MKDYIEDRVNEVANYMIESKNTVRGTAKIFGIGKSTVEKDLKERLPQINPQLSKEVEEVLQHNKSVRHLRGGLATQRRYKGAM